MEPQNLPPHERADGRRARSTGGPSWPKSVSIQQRGAVVELGLSGELDVATAPPLGEAMARLRSGSGRAKTIVIDTSDVDRVAEAGYRALQAALVGPNGVWDPKTALIVGPAVARFEAEVSAAGRAGALHVMGGRVPRCAR
jgi:hypothetical protein